MARSGQGPDQPGRRRFLKAGAGAAAGIVGVRLGLGRSVETAHADEPTVAAVSQGRSFVSHAFALELEGLNAGWLQSAEGGNVSAQVVTEALGPDYYVKKHLGSLVYEDILLQLGFGMTQAVYDWISASWQGNHQRKNGAVVVADQKLDAAGSREFFNGLITETGIPACDASAKDPAYLTLKIAPEFTRPAGAAGKAGDAGTKEQKLWLPSNFRLEMDGLDCTKVSKIDAFTVKQRVSADNIGDARDYLKEPGKLEFPNLAITLPQSAAQSFYDWHEDFVIKGVNSDGQEKSGTLTFLSPNRQDVLAAIRFFGLGIFRISDGKAEANADAIKRIKVELYCERMEFNNAGNVIA